MPTTARLRGLGLALLLAAPPALAQEIATVPAITLSSPLEARLRRDQLLGRHPVNGWLLRRFSGVLEGVLEPEERGRSTLWLAPELETTWNSGLPLSFNDGALWAGRGLNLRLTGGVRERWGPLTLVLAPELLYEQNRPFQALPYDPAADPPRSRWAHPFHPLPESIDWPIRFGDDPRLALGLGQSSLAVDAGPVRAGLATESLWWGPAIVNGILLSSQAPGFPHAFVSTARPLATPLGDVEATWILGRLSESEFFDLDPTNDLRTLSAAALTLRTAFDPGLTLGVARAVMAPLPPGEDALGASLDFVRGVGQPNSAPPDSVVSAGPDQITDFFFRWAFPPGGFEVWAEWARFEEPESFMDFLEFPYHSQGFTVGLQWVQDRGFGSWLGVELEHTNTEPSGSWRHRRVWTNYSSRTVIQGWTHEGQVLGAAFGPASSGQWLAIDRGWTSGQVGVFAGRARLDNAVLIAENPRFVPDPKHEDVLLFTGVRGGFDVGGWSVHAELSRGVRLNYLFQAFPFDPATGGGEGVDVPSTSLTLTLSRALTRPAAGR